MKRIRRLDKDKRAPVPGPRFYPYDRRYWKHQTAKYAKDRHDWALRQAFSFRATISFQGNAVCVN